MLTDGSLKCISLLVGHIGCKHQQRFCDEDIRYASPRHYLLWQLSLTLSVAPPSSTCEHNGALQFSITNWHDHWPLNQALPKLR